MKGIKCLGFCIHSQVDHNWDIGDRADSMSRWVALTLISWGTTLISSVQHWSSEANWMKMRVESTLFHLFVLYLFIYPIKPSLSSAQYVSACGSTVAFCAHDVISRERLPQMCDNTDTVRSAPIFRNFPNSAGLHVVHEIFFVPFIICFHLVYNESTQLPSSDSKNPILAVDERNTENVRSAYHCHWTHNEWFSKRA